MRALYGAGVSFIANGALSGHGISILYLVLSIKY